MIFLTKKKVLGKDMFAAGIRMPSIFKGTAYSTSRCCMENELCNLWFIPVSRTCLSQHSAYADVNLCEIYSNLGNLNYLL